MFPPPLWGRVGRGVIRRRTSADACGGPFHPYPLPTRGEGNRLHERRGPRMTSWKNEQVLIVGGGIGGLAGALALAGQGIPSQVIEQAAEFKEIGAGIQLGPNVFRMFERLSLIEPISALAVFPHNLIMFDSISGEEV